MAEHFNYYAYLVIMLIGLHAMIAKCNFIKKLIGMSIFQTSIILFFISLGYKGDATIPILLHDAEYGSGNLLSSPPAAAADQPDPSPYPGLDPSPSINPDNYISPLPHVLMLTAIVVGVSTLGVALAISQLVFYHYGSLEENEILAQTRHTDG